MSEISLKDYVDRYADLHLLVHKAERDALIRELSTSDNKFAKANEVREQIDRERGMYITREMHEVLVNQVTVISKKYDSAVAWAIGFGAAVTVVNAVLIIIDRWIK
jgi:hypothetical protein